MSGFSSIALPGKIPVSGNRVSPESLFRSDEEKRAYQEIIDGVVAGRSIAIKRVKVEIFDLSDPKQVKRYEKLWKELLNKQTRMEVVVEARKDLVHRPDGTSYWMKYVEYTEFECRNGSASKKGRLS